MSHRIERIHRQPHAEHLPYDPYAGEDDTHVFEDGVNPFTDCQNGPKNGPENGDPNSPNVPK